MFWKRTLRGEKTSSKYRERHPVVADTEDLELVRKLREGNPDALTSLFDKYSPMVYWIARRMLRDDGEAEEVVQQVFLDTFRAVDQFDANKASYKTWLLQFAYHRTINRKKHLQAKGFYVREEIDEETLTQDIAEGASRQLQFQLPEVVHLVEQLLKSAKPRQRQALLLTFVEGLTAQEIADRTGESADAVRHNIYRGLAKLRTMLSQAATDQTGATSQTKSEGAVLAPRPL